MAKGELVIIGGAEAKEGDAEILREFVRLAGGRRAKIAVLTAATDAPEEVGDTYTNAFERLEVTDIEIVDTRDRREADDRDLAARIERATGIFFSGGNQVRIIERIKGTRLDRTIRDRHAQGAVIGGTSAGAAIMPEIMIARGDDRDNPRLEIIEMMEGMGFLPGVVIDQHFLQRGRIGRLLSALLSQPSTLGIGIDENTAIVVENNQFVVIGEGAVTVVDEFGSTHNNLDQAIEDEAIDLALFEAKLHILPKGYGFNLATRKPIAPPGIKMKSRQTPTLISPL
jgi:cyanophycinase